MDEYQSVANTDRVSQGDVIEWVGANKLSPWQTFGVIVTADCDLVRDKHKGYISYVPAWTTEDFVWYYWRIDAFTDAAERQFEKLAKRLSNWRAKRGGQIALTGGATRLWLRRVGSEKLLDEFGVSDRGERNGLLNLIMPAKEIDDALCCEAPNMSLLARALVHIRGDADGWACLEKELSRYWHSLPGDIFHIPSRPDGVAGDLFLMLRHIRQVSAEDLTAKPDDVRDGKVRAKRTARVSAPFRYAITQNLGKVFADIGLPEDYDKRRSAAAERFREGWTKV